MLLEKREKTKLCKLKENCLHIDKIAYIFSPRHVNVAYWFIYTRDYINTVLSLFLYDIKFW